MMIDVFLLGFVAGFFIGGFLGLLGFAILKIDGGKR